MFEKAVKNMQLHKVQEAEIQKAEERMKVKFPDDLLHFTGCTAMALLTMNSMRSTDLWVQEAVQTLDCGKTTMKVILTWKCMKTVKRMPSFSFKMAMGYICPLGLMMEKFIMMAK